MMGTFGGSIDSRQAPLSRIDIHNTSLSHQNNVNVSVDVVCGPEATITSQLVTGRQAAASVYDWKLSEIWSLGGFNPATRSALRSVEIFRTDTHTSRSFPIHLKKERCFLGAAIDTDSNIIISGGCSTLYQGAEVYSSLEIYSPGSRNSAFEIIPAKMNVLRGGHQSVYDWRRNHLYCLGGYGGGDVYHESMEWVDLSPDIISSGLVGGGFQMCQNDMSVKRTGAGADFGEDGAIYVVGGSPDGARGHNSLERYDPRVGAWEKLTSMEHRRGYLAAKFAPNGNLYAAGGSSLEQFDLFVMEAFHEEIEVYDPRLDAWFAAGNLSEEIADLTIQLWYGGS